MYAGRGEAKERGEPLTLSSCGQKKKRLLMKLESKKLSRDGKEDAIAMG